ncbi:T9SS type A sorting domain-containing protein [Flammeovirga aprica]|uniref:T9SS type A sorting domain-containing protein n=1 Tax=Flammeovirga aprica JL-4 TaxID=694437 RepID=A0A7X9XC79_9BACT|nr:T9SS type A sorting domain-containing protein [Flammeovirga aprica]NME71354.1 T9SS type A sorting domain-containing protein [Flammeovirga aprica JL-4]
MMNKLSIISLFIQLSICSYSWAQNQSIIPSILNNSTSIGGSDWESLSYSNGDVKVTANSGSGNNTTVTFDHMEDRTGNNNKMDHFSLIQGNLTVDANQTIVIEEASYLVVLGDLILNGEINYVNNNGQSKGIYLIVYGDVTGTGDINGGSGSKDEPPYVGGEIEDSIGGDHNGGNGGNIGDLDEEYQKKIDEAISDLPVELVSFTASIKNGGIEINWSTATEINASHFEILSSTDRRNWTSIGEVDAAGNSSSLINYSFLDEREYQSAVYYKLVQYDFDGQNETFGPLVVYPSNELNTLRTAVFPNPATNEVINVQISGMNPGSTTVIQVLTKEGKLIFKDEVSNKNQVATNYQLEIHSSLTPGLYIIKVNSGLQQNIEKLIVR